MSIASNVGEAGWDETLSLHEELVDQILAGNAQRAVQGLRAHLENALRRSLRAVGGHEAACCSADADLA